MNFYYYEMISDKCAKTKSIYVFAVSVGRSLSMKMKILMIRSRMQPSCTPLTPGKKSPKKVWHVAEPLNQKSTRPKANPQKTYFIQKRSDMMSNIYL